MAVLLDEYGGTAGVVTLEDLMEGLVGHLDEEEDGDDGTASVTSAGRGPASDGSRVLEGLMRLSDFEELAEIRLDADSHEVDTVGGLVMHRLGRVPDVGDTICVSGWLVRVEELDGRRVARVRLVPPSPTTIAGTR
jgi:CBS domain containing-hemolysin-like protein